MHEYFDISEILAELGNHVGEMGSFGWIFLRDFGGVGLQGNSTSPSERLSGEGAETNHGFCNLLILCGIKGKFSATHYE